MYFLLPSLSLFFPHFLSIPKEKMFSSAKQFFWLDFCIIPPDPRKKKNDCHAPHTGWTCSNSTPPCHSLSKESAAHRCPLPQLISQQPLGGPPHSFHAVHLRHPAEDTEQRETIACIFHEAIPESFTRCERRGDRTVPTRVVNNLVSQGLDS